MSGEKGGKEEGKKEEKIAYLNILPKDVIFEICSHLDNYKDLTSLSQVNLKFYHLLSENFWEKKYSQEFSFYYTYCKQKPIFWPWKKFYIQALTNRSPWPNQHFNGDFEMLENIKNETPFSMETIHNKMVDDWTDVFSELPLIYNFMESGCSDSIYENTSYLQLCVRNGYSMFLEIYLGYRLIQQIEPGEVGMSMFPINMYKYILEACTQGKTKLLKIFLRYRDREIVTMGYTTINLGCGSGKIFFDPFIKCQTEIIKILLEYRDKYKKYEKPIFNKDDNKKYRDDKMREWKKYECRSHLAVGYIPEDIMTIQFIGAAIDKDEKELLKVLWDYRPIWRNIRPRDYKRIQEKYPEFYQ